jgi:VTC domain
MRYERKYRSEDLSFSEALQVVRDHPMSFKTLHPDRQVNNIYFDTPELHFLRDNLYGVPQRRKYRIRWYGHDIVQAAQPVLEMKCKDGELGDKFMADLEALTLGDRAQLAARFAQGYAAIHATQPPLSSLAAQDLEPVLLNTYLRSYFISYNGKFRLTIDREMRHYAFGARQTVLPFPRCDEAVVLELKYDEADDDAFQRVAQRLPMRLARSSKYTIGMLMVGHV